MRLNHVINFVGLFSKLALILNKVIFKSCTFRDLPGGAVVKKPPANAEDTSLIPGAGRSHMPRSS